MSEPTKAQRGKAYCRFMKTDVDKPVRAAYDCLRDAGFSDSDSRKRVHKAIERALPRKRKK